MAQITLSTPQVSINNDTVRIVPNSLTYDAGEGEINVRAASGGGNNVQSVHSVDAESKIGRVMFDMYVDSVVDSQIAEWKENVGSNSISLTQRNSNGTTIVRSFDGMSLINNVERNAAADGVVSFEFSGDPMSQQ